MEPEDNGNDLRESNDLNISQDANSQEVSELDAELGGKGASEGANYQDVEIDLDELEGDEEDGSARVDQELREAHSEEDRERIKKERKTKQLERRNRAKERQEALRREISSERERRLILERRLEQLEGHQTGTQFGQIEAEEARIGNAIETLQDVIAEATVKADGRAVALATTRLQEALLAKQRVEAYKENFVRNTRKPQAQAVDPQLAARSNEWAKANSWYKGPQAKDHDSMVLTAIDNSVAADGFDPTTPTYWQELNARAKKYLSHRFTGRTTMSNNNDNPASENANTRRTRSAVAGGGNNGASQGGGSGRTMVLSAERVKAMKENGSWDDPERKKDMIRRYQEIDARDRDRER